MKVSVIIPCYNVEAYLEECLESVMNQTIGLAQLEVILVDDASTDSTGKILANYEKRYPDNIMVVLCDENGRQGKARNIGLSYASGDYICFVDSDDIIHRDMLRLLVTLSEECDADLIRFRRCFNRDELEPQDRIEVGIADGGVYTCDSQEKRKPLFLNETLLNCSCTTEFYRRDLLDLAGVSFAEVECYEEALFTVPLRCYVKRVAILKKNLYYSRTNEQGVMYRAMKKPETIMDHVRVQYLTYERLKSEPLYGLMKEEMDCWFLRGFFCKTFDIFAEQQTDMPENLFAFLCETVRREAPEYRNMALRLSEAEQRLIVLIDHEPMEAEVRNLETALCTGNADYTNKCFMALWTRDANRLLQMLHSEEKTAEGRCYRELESLFHICSMMEREEGRDIYQKAFACFRGYARERLSRKMAAGEKLRVDFLPISAAQWPVEEVYERFMKDPRFEVRVIPMPLMDRDKANRDATYAETYRYFEAGGYPVARIYDEKTGNTLPWDRIGGPSDIMIRLTSWEIAIPEVYKLADAPAGTLHYYVPYGFALCDNAGKDYTRNFVYDKEFMNLCSTVYVDSTMNQAEYGRYQLLAGKNVKFSGYTKMDYFLDKRTYSDEELRRIWKLPEGKNPAKVKKFIIAPHYSVGVGASEHSVALSTFDKNFRFLLELAGRYRDRASFIFKPHPNLRAQAVKSGLFKSHEEYDAYLAAWEALPNASVVQEGNYLEIFATSDAMIFDSGSFIAEYVYADKPALFLTKKEQAFNELGAHVLEAHSRCSGEYLQGIEQFVLDVLEGRDERQDLRRDIYDRYLNYYALNHRRASDFVYEDICGDVISFI